VNPDIAAERGVEEPGWLTTGVEEPTRFLVLTLGVRGVAGLVGVDVKAEMFGPAFGGEVWAGA
jgi:hypothetical protein